MAEPVGGEGVSGPDLGRRGIILLLLSLGGESEEDGLTGITRIQKYLFLLEREYGLVPSDGEGGFAFQPYKMGPYSKRLYDDLEMLENLGLVKSAPAGNAGEFGLDEQEDLATSDEATFDELIGESADGSLSSNEERTFRVTDAGRAKVQDLMTSGKLVGVVDRIRKVRNRFSNYSLDDILFYVYSKYPDSAVESEIRERVLSRRKR